MNTESSEMSAAPSQQHVSHPWLANYPPHVNWFQTLQAEPLYTLLDKAAAQYTNKTCTHFLGKETTYKEIEDLTNKAALGLQKIGVKQGTRVGLLFPNTPSYIIFYFAILKIGGIVVNYNPLYTVDELSYQVKDSQTEVMISHDLKLLFDKVEALLATDTLKTAIICPFTDCLPGAKSVLFRLFKGKEIAKYKKSAQRKKIHSFAQITKNNGKFEPVSIDCEKDVAVLQYTGGTTGVPKGAMLTHANLYINVEQLLDWCSVLDDGEERMMGILPFFHVFAMTTVMNFGLAKGCTLILMPKFEINEAMELIKTKKPTIMPGVPTLYNAMINHPKIKKYDFSSLKFCISGGAALPLEIKRNFESLTGATLVEGYGLSETSPVATANPTDEPPREGSIGIPIPQTVLSIRSLDDPAQEMPMRENGEICIAGPQVMAGYWQRPQDSDTAFVGEFFRTGDVGFMDEDGYTYIVDRLKDIIICSGYNVYPRRIEEMIYLYPAVEEVTVVGIADEYRGEAPKAFIKLRKGMQATKEEIMMFLEEKLSKLELPSEIEFRDELPKTMIGKLSKKELREENEKAENVETKA